MIRLIAVALVVSMAGCMDTGDDVAWEELSLEGEEDEEEEVAPVVNECTQECAQTQREQLAVCLVIFPGWTRLTQECRDSARARKRSCDTTCGVVSGPWQPYCTLPLPGCPL